MANRRITFSSILLAVSVVFYLLVKIQIVNPSHWFTKSEVASADEVIAALQPQPAGGRFVMLTGISRTPGGYSISRAGEVVRNAGLFTALINNLNESVVLPRNINILIKPCGEVDAHYDPGLSEIVFCDEFFYHEEELFAQYYQDQSEFNDAVLGAAAFTLFHEISHALIDQLDLPVLGREEDAADQMATYLLFASGASAQAFKGGIFFAYLARNYQPGSSFPYWDEHGLNEQRFYNIACWLYGYDADGFSFVVANGLLPDARAQRCAGESAQSAKTMHQLLGPHLKR